MCRRFAHAELCRNAAARAKPSARKRPTRTRARALRWAPTGARRTACRSAPTTKPPPPTARGRLRRPPPVTALRAGDCIVTRLLHCNSAALCGPSPVARPCRVPTVGASRGCPSPFPATLHFPHRSYHLDAADVAGAAGNPALHCPHASAAGGGVCGDSCDFYCEKILTVCPNNGTAALFTFADKAACKIACAGDCIATYHGSTPRGVRQIDGSSIVTPPPTSHRHHCPPACMQSIPGRWIEFG